MEYSGRTRSIAWLLMPKLLASPGHQQQCYWLCRINGSVSSIRSLQWRHDGYDGVSNHQPHHGLLNRLFGRRSKKTSKLRVTGLCAWNSPGTGEFPAHIASNAENVSISWRHHVGSGPTTSSQWRERVENAKMFFLFVCLFSHINLA